MNTGESLLLRRFVLALALMAGLGMTCRADDKPSPTPVQLDPQVSSVLQNVIAFYTARSSFEAGISSTTNVAMTGMKQQMDSSFHFAVAKPGRWALVAQTGMASGSGYCDGDKVTTYQPILHTYQITKLPMELTDVMRQMHLMLVEGGMPLGCEFLLQNKPLDGLTRNLTASRDLGPDKVGTISARHIQLVALPYTTDYWFADGPQPVLLQTSVTMDLTEGLKKLPADLKKKMPPGFDKMTTSRTTAYANWKFDQPVPPDTFIFHPPPDAKLEKETHHLPPGSRHTDTTAPDVVPVTNTPASPHKEPATVP